MGKSTFKIFFYVRKNQVNKDGTVCIAPFCTGLFLGI